jgi:hypothetical protein
VQPLTIMSSTPRLLYVVTEDWYFLSHRLPMARAAKAAGLEVHIATNVVDGGPAIWREGFILHPTPFQRGRTSPRAAITTILALRKVLRKVQPSVIHHVALQPTVLGSFAAIGSTAASLNAITGLGYTFIGDTPLRVANIAVRARSFAGDCQHEKDKLLHATLN